MPKRAAWKASLNDNQKRAKKNSGSNVQFDHQRCSSQTKMSFKYPQISINPVVQSQFRNHPCGNCISCSNHSSNKKKPETRPLLPFCLSHHSIPTPPNSLAEGGTLNHHNLQLPGRFQVNLSHARPGVLHFSRCHAVEHPPATHLDRATCFTKFGPKI